MKGDCMMNKLYERTIEHKSPSNRVFIWLVIGCLFAATLGYQIFTNLSQVTTLKTDLTVARLEHTKAQSKNVALKTYVDLLNTDEYVLKLARHHSYYSLPNEIIFTIPEDNALLKNEKNRQEALQKQQEQTQTDNAQTNK